jgi:hypothetical protein
LSGSAVADLPETLRRTADSTAKLSHALRRASDSGSHDFFTTTTIEEVLRRPLPRPREQADFLVRWIAKFSPEPGERVIVSFETHAGVIGAKSPAGFELVVNHLFEKSLLTGTLGAQGRAGAALTFAGWDYYEQLTKGSTAYRKAFMAMRFGDAELDRMLTDVFRPAAKQTGFDLFKLDDVPRAGLIDDRLRVEIQSSDFVVADLSHDNLGAYWEAGYAEGLGKPVIYTCEQAKFETTKTHFDTNHHLTIVWSAKSPEVAGEALKATIRATLPHLARQADDAA